MERVARKYIDTGDMAFIVVGDTKEIGERISALGLAPVKFLTVDDVLGPAPQEEN